MKICSYGCEREAKYKMISGKWCCESHYNKCPEVNKRRSEGIKRSWSDERKDYYSKIFKKYWKDPNHIFNSEKWKQKNSEGVIKAWKDPDSSFNTEEFKLHRSIANIGENNPMYGKPGSNKYTLKMLKERHPFFCLVEEPREYNKGLQVRCKKCNEWFTPTSGQLTERIRQLEKEDGNDRSYLYCSEECKQKCSIFNKKYVEFLNIDDNLYYTDSEYQTWRKEVFRRSNNLCEYCGELAEHAHHIKPQKLEPFFALDPDYGVACCMKCHYKKGHQTGTECSTMGIASRICNNGVKNENNI